MTIPAYQPAARALCEILKALRGRRMKREEIAAELGVTIWTADRVLDEFVEGGIIRRELGQPTRTTGGRRPYVYYLASEWGGKAC